MNSKLLRKEEILKKIDNLKNINISELITKNKKFKGFREQKKMNKMFNKKNNNAKRINTNQINKNAKISKLSIELFPDKPLKINQDLLKNKAKLKKNLSNRKFYPKKYINMISELTENNYQRKKIKKNKSFNKNKKEKINLCKKILEGNHYINYDGGIPLMDFGKSKLRKKNMSNTTIKEKSISFNQRNNISHNNNNINNNIVSKPQCLYKGPLKYDISGGGDEIGSNNNNHSLFKTFMSRNLKPAKQQESNHKENLINDSQACTFIKYDVNGTMKTKRIFNSTFHLYNNDLNENNKIRKEIVTTVNNNNNGKGCIKKRTFGGIMLSNKIKLF